MMRLFRYGPRSYGKIGARPLIRRVPAWTNPYITDGLVSMFDGQWNAGGGVHDTGVLFSWADLASGHPASITNGALAGDDYLDFSTNAAWAVPSTEYDALTGRGGPFTLVMILTFPEDVPSTLFACAHTGTNKNMMSAIRTASGVSSISMFTTNTYLSWVPLGASFPQGVQHITLTNAGGSSPTMTINGESFSVPSSTTGFQAVVTCFGNHNLGTMTASVQRGVPKYYHARLYNRVLSSAELDADYAIDKLRFNLP